MTCVTRILMSGLVVVLAGCPSRPATQSPPPASAAANPEPTSDNLAATSTASLASQLAEFNRGAGLMEQYDYVEAAAAFEKVLAAFPDWQAARFNLGLAYLNTEGESKSKTRSEGQPASDAARKTLEAVLAVDPNHLPAKFALGIYYQHRGDDAKALEYYQAVYACDSADPYVVYRLADALLRVNRNDEGLRMLEKVAALDPGFVSALYRLALQYQRAGKVEQAKTLFDRFKKLSAAELAGKHFLVGDAYGASGKYYQALGVDNLPLPRPPAKPVARVLFSPEPNVFAATAQVWDWAGGQVALPGIAVGDLDGDGDLDVCFTGVGEKGATTIWLNDGTGRFSPGPTLVDQGVSPCFGDFDNDGYLDLWLGRVGGDKAFRNDGKGHFESLANTPFATDAGLTHLARLVDIDSDGDLDFLAFRLSKGVVPLSGSADAGKSSLYLNNRDGTFVDAVEELGLGSGGAPVAAVVCDDFDNDRDLDLMIFPAGDGLPLAWVNDRVGGFHRLEAAVTGCDAQHVVSAVSGDFNKDGNRDLLVFTEQGVRLYANRGPFRFEEDKEFAAQHGRLRGTGGQFVDIDNDGDLDIVIPDAQRQTGGRGPVLLLNDWPQGGFRNANETDPGNLLNAIQFKGDASCVVADFTGDGKCDILLAPSGEKPLLIENATPEGHWLELDLRGTEEQGSKTRSNSSAIGARVEIKTGAVLQQFVVGGNAGPLAMSPLRIHAGLGENVKVDWLRILWPDGVLQAEIELSADHVKTVREEERKSSSCPYLFAWDGTHFDFVADFGGVGGLGFWIAPGTYTPPDPTEYLPIPQLRPRGGEYVLQCLTPLEEVTYLDEAKLIAVDHPEGTTVYPHEMMAVSVPPPPFELFCIRDHIEPLHAVNHQGENVIEQLRKIDRLCAGATVPDRRFLGLAEEHFVELDFGDRLRNLRPEGRLILCLYGWVEYGYSSTNYAAHQAGLRTRAPSVQVQRDGQWVELFHEAGYPAGINHLMTLDVTGQLRPGDQRLRISSNMELYWDCIFLAEHLPDAPLTVHEVGPHSADLHFLGYPREYTPDGRRPNLADYDNLDHTVAWKLMSGAYTRYGEVAELLQEADDCYVIMGHGEEVTLRFAVEAFGPVPEGYRRTFLLKTDSYCKDMDLCTAHPDGVEPLPFHGMSGYPYRPDEHYPQTPKLKEYQRRFNTRRMGERSPSAR